MHDDDRGSFTELFRRSWGRPVDPLQWNVVTSRAEVFRGVHVHARHADYLSVIHGHVTIGLRDIRPGSPTLDLSALVEMRGEEVAAIEIPPGVAHGFYSRVASTHIYGVDQYWDLADELGCHWTDPALELSFPCTAPLLSERDTNAGSFASMRAAWAAHPATV
jgi:dTDP-4-dehydrorhamnose 3,5-epimerase